MAFLAAGTTVKDFGNELMDLIRAGLATNDLARNVLSKLNGTSDPVADAEIEVEMNMDAESARQSPRLPTWSTIDGALAYEGRMYVPKDEELRSRIISFFHDPPESGHFGALRTAELASREFYWPYMESSIRN